MKESSKNIISFYENLTPDTLLCLKDFYHEECYFKDPFHEFKNRDDLQKTYQKMFSKLKDPKFFITNHFEKENELVLFWDFKFNDGFIISGNTLFVFDQNQKVISHIDYWDSVNEIWLKFPLLRTLITFFYKFF